MIRRILLITVLFSLGSPAWAESAPSPDNVLLRAMKTELERAKTLSLPKMARPYFIAYRAVDIDELSVVAEFGGIVTSSHERSRYLGIELRVGDRSFDNGNFEFFSRGPPVRLTVDDDLEVLRHQIWLATDRTYKNAVEQLEKKRAALSNLSESETVPEYSEEKATEKFVEGSLESPEVERLTALARRLSAEMRDFPALDAGGVVIHSYSVARTFLDVEGSSSSEVATVASVSIVCRTHAEDGMRLFDFGSLVVPSSGDLPGEAALIAEVRRVASEVTELSTASVVEDYAGPVLFEGRAAGQLLQHLLAGNLSGTPPPKDPMLAQIPPQFRQMASGESAFSNRIGKLVLPRSFTVVDDPLRESAGKEKLIGAYRVDDEGVPAQKVLAVDKGKLESFLMSRIPRKDFLQSNGHGRGGLGTVRARASNLIVTSKSGLSKKKLRAMLLGEAKAAGEEYALIVRLLDERALTGQYEESRNGFFGGGGGQLPRPLVVVKVTADGKEQLVRGVSFGALSVRALRDIIATGRKANVHNYFQGTMGPSGAYGGGPMFSVPSSIVTPSLLLEEVELVGHSGPQSKPPVLTRPTLVPVAPKP